MASYVTPKKNTQYIFYVGLVDQSNTKLLKANPTIAAGDFQVSTDGGALGNLGTLPTVTPAAGRMVKITLSTSEMNGDNVTLVCVDAAGAEWCDQIINIQTSARQIDDLAYPATSGRSMVVDASGLVDSNAVKLGPTGAGTAQTARDVGATLGVAGAGLTALGDARIANLDATVSSRSTFAGGAVASVTAGVTLSAAAVQAIWDAATSALVTAGSIGKWILDKLDVVLSTRLATSGYTAPPSAATISAAVVDQALAGHSTAGTVGAALASASSAGDPWSTAIPGAYGVGTAGYILGNGPGSPNTYTQQGSGDSSLIGR